MEAGEAIFDSRVIVEYLDTMSPVGKLMPPTGRERIEVRTWEALADGLLDAAVAARLEATWSGRSEGQRSQAWIDRQMRAVQRRAQGHEPGPGRQALCAGNHFTLADVAVGCALGYLDFRFPHIDWRGDYPNLAQALRQAGHAAELHRQRPAYRLIGSGLPPGDLAVRPPAARASPRSRPLGCCRAAPRHGAAR
jgi:glutathione S-transferase